MGTRLRHDLHSAKLRLNVTQDARRGTDEAKDRVAPVTATFCSGELLTGGRRGATRASETAWRFDERIVNHDVPQNPQASWLHSEDRACMSILFKRIIPGERQLRGCDKASR